MKKERQGLFDSPRNVTILMRIFYGCCVALLLLDFIINRHIVHSWESLWGFYPLYGFVGCVVLVIVATRMRSLLMRDADYYSKEGGDDQQLSEREISAIGNERRGAEDSEGDKNVDD